MENGQMKRVLVAGASGFIGEALIESLLKDESIQVIALSRAKKTSQHPRLIWKKCDLYSLKQIREVMIGCDSAYYLVHSMLPSASLSQGKFYNFVRGARASGIKKIIYLGGLVPNDSSPLSWHLKSRFEVETALKQGAPTWVMLRAGLIIGKNGSSFTILKKLIERLPLLFLPLWAENKMEPIALPDVVRILIRCLKEPSLDQKTFDIGGREQLTYRDLILKTATFLKKKIHTLNLDFIPLKLSGIGVPLITQLPRDLIYPLILSLKHSMLVDPIRAWPFPEDIQISIDEALISAVDSTEKSAARYQPSEQKDVRSIQRIVNQNLKSAEWITEEYFRWLPLFFKHWIKVEKVGTYLHFKLWGIKLLILEKNHELSHPDRQLLYIKGGVLSRFKDRGRLEFREVMNGEFVLAALHEFYPSLPWGLYKLTQAQIHLWTMKAFERHLQKLAKN